MFLRKNIRRKDGKVHCTWSIVENRRVADGKVVQRQVLYLGELNGCQREAWRKSIDVFFEDKNALQPASLFPEAFAPLEGSAANGATKGMPIIKVRLGELELRRPRQWGACWLACELWETLKLREFWTALIDPSREGTDWVTVLQILVTYRWLAPGSEWRLHRKWFDNTAMGDLLHEDFSIVEIHKLYKCHDFILPHKTAFFAHLRDRWKELFQPSFEVLLYDLTSTYFECVPPDEPPPGTPEDQQPKRKFGYSRDKRSDCVQIVIALVLTPEGFPLGYEVFSGNTTDKTTLRGMLEKIKTQHGVADRIWLMDRGIPTEEVLKEMRESEPPVRYLVGTPKGRLSKLEADLLASPWQEARPKVQVKLLPQEGETYVLARSEDRVCKERSMRRRRMKKLRDRLKEIQKRSGPVERDKMHELLGAAKQDAGLDARFFKITVTPVVPTLTENVDPKAGEAIEASTTAAEPVVEAAVGGGKPGKSAQKKAKKPKKTVTKEYVTLSWSLDKRKLAEARRREGRYLLRTNESKKDPVAIWEQYLLLVEVEQAFKELKGDLAIRPVYHQLDHRIEAHIFISFIAYCLQVTLKNRLRRYASGLTPRSVLEKLAEIQMLDVHLPTTDGRQIVMSRYSKPSTDVCLLLDQLKLTLPEQAPPRIGQYPKDEPKA